MFGFGGGKKGKGKTKPSATEDDFMQVGRPPHYLSPTYISKLDIATISSHFTLPLLSHPMQPVQISDHHLL